MPTRPTATTERRVKVSISGFLCMCMCLCVQVYVLHVWEARLIGIARSHLSKETVKCPYFTFKKPCLRDLVRTLPLKCIKQSVDTYTEILNLSSQVHKRKLQRTSQKLHENHNLTLASEFSLFWFLGTNLPYIKQIHFSLVE